MHSKLTIGISFFSVFHNVRKIYLILMLTMLACIGCEWRLRPSDDKAIAEQVRIERYDRIESLYLTTGDFSALQQMNTSYPMQTRTLIEDVLRIGRVNDPEINNKFLAFFQDSTLQELIREVERQYSSMDDLNRDLAEAFKRLKRELPDMKLPKVYSQIGSLDQSIIVAHNTLGISLDKYLGADYPTYQKYYNEVQQRQMTRSMIVPDCMAIYILSLYPMPSDHEVCQTESDVYISKIQWVVNKILSRQVFKGRYINAIGRYMQRHPGTTVEELLINSDYLSLIHD